MSDAAYVIVPGATAETHPTLVVVEEVLDGARRTALFGYYLDPEAPGSPPEVDPLDHDGDGEKGGSLPDAPPSLSGKTKAELIDIALDEEVADVTDEMTVAEIKAAIEAARAAKSAA